MFAISNAGINYEKNLNLNYLTGCTQLMVPGRTSASSRLVAGSVTSPIDPELLKGTPDIMQISVKSNLVENVELDANSKQIWDAKIHWIRALRLADDCHSFNVLLNLHPDKENSKRSKLILEVVRNVEIGQELLLWFSDDILRLLQIVFLSPANIQGQNKYVCTNCLVLYEYPNPLKLHIMLECGRKSVSTLWEKLAIALQENNVLTGVSTEFTFKLTPEPPTSLSSSICGSAFKPVVKKENNNLPIEYPRSNVFYPEGFLGFSSDEAQIETLMSNLGKSKEGHMCLYCGKCYSRKYGLKIHIRTHTGYKPLKCKFCLRPFGDPSNLNKHVRLHAEGETPYKCDLCGKILVRRRDLDRHIKSRHINVLTNLKQNESSSDDLTDDDHPVLSTCSTSR